MADDEWEVLGPGRLYKPPTIAVTKDGSLRLNKALVEAMGEPKHVQVFVRRGRQQVGVKPATAGEFGALAVMVRKMNGIAAFYEVGGKAMWDSGVRRPQDTKGVRATLDEEHGIWYIRIVDEGWPA